MDHGELNRRLVALGYDTGGPGWGSKCEAALIKALTDGPDWPVTAADIAQAAETLKVDEAVIWTIHDVESSGDPFIDGRPAILFEPHRFSRSTNHRYDTSHPSISSRSWNRKLYPRAQEGRYRQLIMAVRLDVDAAFMSASYGAFQILGENWKVCGAISPWSFAWKQAQTEGDQLEALVRFVEGTRLVTALRKCRPGDPDSCIPFVGGYNGTGFRSNRYHIRFAEGLARRMAG